MLFTVDYSNALFSSLVLEEATDHILELPEIQEEVTERGTGDSRCIAHYAMSFVLN
jgi:hypothetical protein